MSHLAVRIVSEWLADPDYGVNAVAAIVPRDGSDPAPGPVDVTDELTDGWVARGATPRQGAGLGERVVSVSLQPGQTDGGIPQATDTGAWIIAGNLTLAITLRQESLDTAAQMVEAMYLLRAIRGSLILLDQAERDADRTRCGIQLQPSVSMQFGRPAAEPGDTIAAGAVLVTYPVLESVPVAGALP